VPSTKRGPFSPGLAPTYNYAPWLTDIDDAAFRFSNDVFNVKDRDYGAVGNDSTNDTTAIQAAIDAAVAVKGTVFLPPGRYRCAGLTASGTFGLVGSGIGRSVLVQNANSDILLAQGSQGSAVTLTANAAKGDLSLSFNTSGFAAGDYIVLYSSTAWTLSATGGQFGEILRLKAITSGSAAELYSAVDSGPYNTAATASVRKLNFLDGLSIASLSFDNSAPGTRTSPAVNLRWIKNVYTYFAAMNIDGPGLALNSCLGGRANVFAYDLTDDTANSRFGYGISVINCSRDIDCYVEADNVRHAFTTDTTGSGSLGVPRHITVSGVARNCRSASWDTHADGEHITFHNVVVDGAWGTVSENANGIQVRAPNVTIVDPDIAGTKTHGIRTRYDSTASSGMNGINCTVLGGKIHDLVGTPSAIYNSGAAGFRVASPMVIDNVAGTVITNDQDNASVSKQMFVHGDTTIANSGTSMGGTAQTFIDRLPGGGTRNIAHSGTGQVDLDFRSSFWRITETSASNYTVSVLSGLTADSFRNMEFVVEVFNNSGGAMGTVTWDTGKFTQAGWAAPANGKRKTGLFRWNGLSSRWFLVGTWSADL